MAAFARSPVTAVLGPTNTGKTHLAVERMCGHSSGMIGFPLRLLAREVYDRVVRLKGERQVALLTGEEKILPRDARYFCCTAESMPVLSGRPAEGPVSRDYAFVALDEAQLGADPERGHVFTDRLLHARGREETMILGSAALTPLVRSLVPEAEIIARPRFSTLTYAGAKKLSRLPPRSAIVAFSAEQVYAVAEMLRRFRGGAAVVMGALSPRTRNAQVAMFQAGEVDYLVATDAIGMGLNMDVAHVAFAGLSKFDGNRVRRLTVAEMAQIAGRAGRHQRDGTFGVLGTGAEGDAAFTAEEIERIEEHRFQRMHQLYWREGDPDRTSVGALIGSLEEKPGRPELIAAPEAVDLAVLKRLAGDPALMARAVGERQVTRLWAACGLPDFQKLGADHHARLVTRVWRFLSEGDGHIPQGWFAGQVARLDRVDGDIDTLSARIAAARSWSYIAHRADWLKAPDEMAERTRGLEDRLSDALHGALTQRFVDRRTAVLLRDVGRRAADLPVDVDGDGTVSVDGAHLGRLEGFRFHVDPQARAGDRKLLLAAAERRLGRLLADKAAGLIAAPDAAFALAADATGAPALSWNEHVVARLMPGASLLSPEIRLDKALGALKTEQRTQVSRRLNAWVEAQIMRHLRMLKRIADGARDAALPVGLRALLAQLAEAGGIADRASIDPALAGLDKGARHALRREGVVIGALDLFHPGLMKPGAMRWRLALQAARTRTPMVEPPPAGAVLLGQAPAGAGFRRLGEQWLRIDIAERLVRAAHERLDAGQPVGAGDMMIVSLGLSSEAFTALMRAAGFRALGTAALDAPNWTFRGRHSARRPCKPPSTPRAARPGAFSDLADMLGFGG